MFPVMYFIAFFPLNLGSSTGSDNIFSCYIFLVLLAFFLFQGIDIFGERSSIRACVLGPHTQIHVM